jgi:hypothetical protein
VTTWRYIPEDSKLRVHILIRKMKVKKIDLVDDILLRTVCFYGYVIAVYAASERPITRSRCRWKDNIKMKLKERVRECG